MTMIVESLITKRPVLVFYAVVFAVSWGGFLAIGGPGLLGGTDWQTDPLFLSAVLAMLAGPPIGGVLLTALLSGRDGMRELLSRLLKWRVGTRWYVVALLTAPLVVATILFSLSLLSREFLPAIVKAEEKASLLLPGIAFGLAGGFVEELGWTGFAIPQLRRRYRILSTGLLVGILWGVWHFLQMWWVGRASVAGLPPAFFLSLYFLSSVATLAAYRVLMVWVYDRTGSLLAAILMHASYIFTTLFVLAPPLTGLSFLTYSCAFAAVLWIMVAVIAFTGGLRDASRSELAPSANLGTAA